MRAIMLICLTIGLGTTALAGNLYRWVDDNGRVHYSDRPQPGAETVELGPAQTYTAPRTPSAAAAAPPARPAAQTESEPDLSYTSVAIASPASQQVLWNIGAVLPVSVALDPGLHPGHRLVVRYNNTPVADWPERATSHRIQNVFRGTHTVSASVVDANGVTVATSEPVTFYVKQTSILLN